MPKLRGNNINHEINPDNLKKLAKSVLEVESREITNMLSRIDDNFVQACQYMLACEGRVVVIGMGKSGHIAGKIAATFASTGTPAFFVHPGEASHGDLGMITPKDVVLAISYSGETDEILTILPIIKRLGVPLISLTGKNQSTLAKNSSVNIDVRIDKEACPLGLAPTSSTTATLAMGDALAISLLETRGFTKDDFARSHPAGQLGRRLLLLIGDIMNKGDGNPIVYKETPLSDALIEMSQKGLGMTSVIDDKNKIIGIFTDGDLRRLFDTKTTDIHSTAVGDVMIPDCKTASETMLAAEALQMMQKYKVNALPIVDDDNKLVGTLNMHDLLRAGVV
ncbi:MAG: KpsF/GutQ family sugar-phosphate isomerase [Gammaproteobacteria bacterium]|nr:KpsF/GutQ family sugar-phosphate isomerase [Gammaproteobacteria bacterium]